MDDALLFMCICWRFIAFCLFVRWFIEYHMRLYMKQVGGYKLPDNAKLSGIGFSGCFYYNNIGDIYIVRYIDGEQHFRKLPDVELNKLIREVSLHAV